VKQIWGISLVVFVLTSISYAQITRTATFENYVAGQEFKPSFTDPASEILFSNSTGPTHDFDITNGLPQFNNGNYLTSGSIGLGAESHQFGFTGSFPVPANAVSLEVSNDGIGNPANVTLEGFDIADTLVTEQSGSASSPDPFILQISSSQYNITSFIVMAVDIDVAYDNISYTILPEPALVSLPFLGISLLAVRRRKIVACR
jgi:hypothetical protein